MSHSLKQGARLVETGGVIRFRVRYARPSDLVADYEEQFRKGGLLVRVDAPAGAAQFDAAVVELEALSGPIVLPAQIVQIVPGAGVALSFDATGAALLAAVDEAREAGESAGDPPAHSLASDSVAGNDVPADAGKSRPRAAPPAGSAAAKIHAALHGSKEDRGRILRDGDRTLHRYVLRNPGLRLDEVGAIAKMTSVSPDLLKAIAERREWAGRPEIALALVRNPKCPVPLATRLLQNVGASELRRLAKSSSVRMPILQAARKMVVG